MCHCISSISFAILCHIRYGETKIAALRLVTQLSSHDCCVLRRSYGMYSSCSSRSDQAKNPSESYGVDFQLVKFQTYHNEQQPTWRDNQRTIPWLEQYNHEGDTVYHHSVPSLRVVKIKGLVFNY